MLGSIELEKSLNSLYFNICEQDKFQGQLSAALKKLYDFRALLKNW